MATATVPEVMLGCWRRAWIEFADGTFDDRSSVVWLQTESRMVDVRISADRGSMPHRSCLQDCSLDELRALATSDASSGFTECGPVSANSEGIRAATATWNTRAPGVTFQPVSAFTEPGLMTWNEDATVMIERAPSGAYVEQWHLVPGSRAPLSVSERDGCTIYRTGGMAALVRDRVVAVPRHASLQELVEENAANRAVVEQLLDCEFSVAERTSAGWTITSSTLPWRRGQDIDVEG